MLKPSIFKAKDSDDKLAHSSTILKGGIRKQMKNNQVTDTLVMFVEVSETSIYSIVSI